MNEKIKRTYLGDARYFTEEATEINQFH